MIVIDKLCYHSRLRYENAGEKFAFAIITLCICVMSRSIAVAGIVLAVTGVLTVKKGGVPVSCYLRFLTAPIIFLLLSTIAIMFHLSRTPMDMFAIPVGNWYITTSYSSFFYAVQLIFHSFRNSILSVFFILYYTYAGYFTGFKKTSLS